MERSEHKLSVRTYPALLARQAIEAYPAQKGGINAQTQEKIKTRLL